ncbi:hypothetical protein ACMA1D_18225, partial [Streptomyces sp. 796.1]
MSMSRARVARRIATAAAYGGGGIGLLGGAAVGLLLTEVRMARRVVGGSGDVPPAADGRYGTAFDRDGDTPPLRLAFLGDSTAAGQGVRHAHQTPGALLASGLAAVAERPVELRVVALPGAQSDDLARQVARLLAPPTDPHAEPAAPAPHPDAGTDVEASTETATATAAETGAGTGAGTRARFAAGLPGRPAAGGGPGSRPQPSRRGP